MNRLSIDELRSKTYSRMMTDQRKRDSRWRAKRMRERERTTKPDEREREAIVYGCVF
ncbi:hypothetical protein Hanom_Chr08g00755201 [Helianthus anomalus]